MVENWQSSYGAATFFFPNFFFFFFFLFTFVARPKIGAERHKKKK